MASLGKQKGAEFERKICKLLSLWISGDTCENLFWRSAMSGGRATLQRKKGEVSHTQSGDITAIHPLGRKLVNTFVIECKFYRTMLLDQILYMEKGRGLFLPMWEKVKVEAQSELKEPLLILKQNNKTELLCLTSEGVRKLAKLTLGPPLCSRGRFPYHDLVIFPLSDFLNRRFRQ